MNEFEERLIDKLKKDIEECKKLRPERDWDFIYKKLHILSDAALELKENLSFEEYSKLTKEIVEEEKTKFERREYTRGVSEKHENWFSFENLYNSKYWTNFSRMMDNWDKSRFETNKKQSIEIINHLSNPRKNDTSIDDAIRKGLVYGHVQSGKTGPKSIK